MPMDGLTIGAIVFELNEALAGGRIDKVNQPENDEIHLLLYAGGEQRKLLICTGAANARLHLTEISKSNPPSASPFCMLLRKHLTGARFLRARQVENERIVFLSLEGRNDFHEPEEKRLIVEIMGKHSNLILTDQNGRILDCIRRVNAAMSRIRQLQPGLSYRLPPSQGRTDPFTHSPETISSPRYLADSFTGLSRQAAEEIYARAESSTLKSAFDGYIDLYRTHTFSPVVLVDEQNEPLDYFAVKQMRFQDARQKPYDSLSLAIDACVSERDAALRRQERARDLRQKIRSLIEKTEQKRAQQAEKAQECDEMETLRISGELLTANLFRVPRGASEISLPNFYDDMRPFSIPLDPTLSGAANAQKFFKKYAKLKTAKRLLDQQTAETARENEFLSDLADSLETCETAEDLADIRRELEAKNYLKTSKTNRKETPSKPMHFLSSAGLDIFVGKNNTQNDRLTLHFASPDDLWFHTRDIHGSHVILHAENADERSIEEAAMLAAHFSKGRQDTVVPVDCTRRRFVKKPAGCLPGKVIYTHQNTYFIRADSAKIKELRRL